MQWAHRIRRKISAALLLAAIFVLVFVKNMVENQYVSELGASFASVYEDRLVVESYIYRLSDHLFRKKIMIDSCNTPQGVMLVRDAIAEHNEAIAGIITRYEGTKLTDTETRYFSDFKENVNRMQEAEQAFLTRAEQATELSEAKTLVSARFEEASRNLKDLSVIQISEGKLLNDHSKRIIAGSSLLTQFELGILIAIGLMILVLVFESTSVFIRRPEGPELN